jgi:hypothetical protein
MTGRAPLPYDFMPAVPSFELRSGQDRSRGRWPAGPTATAT